MFKKQLFFLALILFLGACAPTPQPAPNVNVPPVTEVPVQAPTAPAEMCPTATADLKLMVNTEDGYCLLYPAEFTWDGWQMVVLNPYDGPGDIPGDAWMNMEVSDAGGQTAAQIVDAELAALGVGFNITRTELTIDGKPAILLDGLPAFDSARFVYIVNNDRLYRFGFLPWYPQGGTTPLEKLYQLVVESVHFLP
ncbi:MAG: hypothetical protein ACOYZ6_14960 [Chloroflexota bacterium]